MNVGILGLRSVWHDWRWALSGRMLNGCETGGAKITKGYDLPAWVTLILLLKTINLLIRRHVIHTVGPIYSETFKEEKAKQLASCYRTCLELAAENELRHIVCPFISHLFTTSFFFGIFNVQAFPSISTGLYSFPIEAATRVALITTRTFLESEQGRQVRSPSLFELEYDVRYTPDRKCDLCGLE